MDQRTAAALREGRRQDVRHSHRPHRSVQSRTRAAFRAYGHASTRQPVARIVGDVRPGQRERKPARALSCCCPAARRPTRASRCGARASCRASIRACSAARREIRCCTSAILPGSIARCGGECSGCAGRNEQCRVSAKRRQRNDYTHRAIRAGVSHARCRCPR